MEGETNYLFPNDTVGVIRNTFILLPFIGTGKERRIWESGIRTWDDFLAADAVCSVRPKDKEADNGILAGAEEKMREGRAGEVANLIPSGERWRMFGELRANAKYLDIETDGMSRHSSVTLVTVHSSEETVTLTRGEDLNAETLAEALDGTEILVTYNGSCFDVPVLKNAFPEMDLTMPQFDLRFASGKLGYTGGLKPLEIDLGIVRDEEIDGMNGADAVRLWKMWIRHGDDDALNLLTEYNRADTVNLERIADIVYGRLVREHACYRWRHPQDGAGS